MMDEPEKKVGSPAAKLQKRIKKGIRIGIALAVVWCLIQFGCHTMQGDAMSGKFEEGTRLLYDGFFNSHIGCMPSCDTADNNLQRRSTILFTVVNESESMTFVSEIAGVPGDPIVFTDEHVIIGRERYRFGLRRVFKRPEGNSIPPRKYFVVNYNRNSRYPDSRDFGYVDADRITGKVIIGF